jgi:hypothetical protein
MVKKRQRRGSSLEGIVFELGIGFRIDPVCFEYFDEVVDFLYPTRPAILPNQLDHSLAPQEHELEAKILVKNILFHTAVALPIFSAHLDTVDRAFPKPFWPPAPALDDA